MNATPPDSPADQIRDHFSDAVNRSASAGETAYAIRGHGHERAATITPAALIDADEELLDHEDGRIAQERLDEIQFGRVRTVSAADVGADLGL